MKKKRSIYIFIITSSVLFITYLHYSTIPKVHALHDIYRELYYIPLLIGAMAFGLRGALLTYLFITAVYAPYIIESWSGDLLFETKRLLYFLFSGIFSYLAGFLIDRDRKQRKQMEHDRYLAAIGQFAAGIVHDLKNPLISILGFAKRIQEGKGNVTSSIQTIIDSAQDMRKITLEVLDFAKPSHLALEEDMRNIIARSCDVCRTKAEEKSVILSTELPSTPIKGMFDSLHMERAISNLLSNAIDASGKDQDIRIRADLGKDSIIIKIKDNGSGMDKETLENIFTLFYTGKRTGTGLGLPIAKKIIDEHGGEIVIKSQLGTGTEVTIYMPLSRK